MGKYILFAATHRNGGMICRGCGEWLHTKYVVYSDGTCWMVSKYDAGPHDCSILPEHIRTEAQRPHVTRMDENAFHKLKNILENQFDGINAVMGCDGTWWEMHRYGPSGRRLHSIRGHIYGVSVLEEISKLLAKHA